MTITEVGNAFGIEDRIDFFSTDYFIDRDILIINMSVLWKEINSFSKDRGYITREEQNVIEHWLKRKTNELKEFYKYGGVVILNGDAFPKKWLKNDPYLDKYFEIDLGKIFIEEYIGPYENKKGFEIIMEDSLKMLKERLVIDYNFTFKSLPKEYQVLCTTIKSKEKLSFKVKVEEGLIVWLPSIRINPHAEYDPNDFVKALISFVKTQRNSPDEIILNIPSWLSLYNLEKEADIINNLEEEEKKKKEIEKGIERLEEKRDKYLVIKSILYLSGKELEYAVQICMKHLGINSSAPEGRDTDLILEEKGEYFAVEIKGVSGSATKKHVRQLEEWTNKCAEEYNIEEAKGLLIINTFNNKPLDERAELDFPPNVLEFSISRKHCLITTRTLLGIINDFDKKIINKESIIKLLKETEGELNYQPKN